MTTISVSRPFAFRLAQPASATFKSRSAIRTFAPASARASAQASPIPWPAPVTRAVFRSSLNFSRYIFLLFLLANRSERARFRSCPDHRTILVKTVQPGRIGRKPHAVAGLEIELSDTACRQHSEFAGIHIEEGVAAQMLGDRHDSGPAFSLLSNPQVFRPDAESGDTGLSGRRAGHKIHFWRADEAGDEKIRRAFIKFKRRAVLFDVA